MWSECARKTLLQTQFQSKLDLQILDMESNNEVAAEIVPLRYLSKITGKSLHGITWYRTFTFSSSYFKRYQ